MFGGGAVAEDATRLLPKTSFSLLARLALALPMPGDGFQRQRAIRQYMSNPHAGASTCVIQVKQ